MRGCAPIPHDSQRSHDKPAPTTRQFVPSLYTDTHPAADSVLLPVGSAPPPPFCHRKFPDDDVSVTLPPLTFDIIHAKPAANAPNVTVPVVLMSTNLPLSPAAMAYGAACDVNGMPRIASTEPVTPTSWFNSSSDALTAELMLGNVFCRVDLINRK